MNPKELEVGKLYTIKWGDIVEDPRGNPEEAVLKAFSHTYRYHSTKVLNDKRKRITYLVFTASTGPDYYHSVAIPTGCIISIEIVRQE